MDLPSRLDLYAVGRAYMRARARALDPKIVDVEGSDANLFVGSASFMAAAVVRQLTARTAALTLEGSEGEDLDRYLWDKCQELRKGASAARGEARFFRSSLAGGSGSFPVGTKLGSLTGVEYVTTQVAAFSATSYEARARVRATRAGKEFQVGRNQIRRLLPGPTPPFDATVKVTNDEPTAGGEPREEDDDFRKRGRDFWPAARRGTLEAISYGARRVAGVMSADPREVLDVSLRPARLVVLHIADSSGVASRALTAEVEEELLEWRCAGIAVVPDTSIPQMVSTRLRLTFRAGTATADLAEAVRAAVVNFVNSLGVNRPLLRFDLGAVLARYRDGGLIPEESSVVEPAGDLYPDVGRTLRTTADLVELV